MTKIEWTEKTWNPCTGCTKISPGCKNCYAEKMANRLFNMKKQKYANKFAITTHHDTLELPKKWRKPSMIFVNSMSDLFHNNVPESFIREVFTVMNTEKRHTFQILTKRAERILELNDSVSWSNNIWMGVSVENNNYVNRIELLKRSNAHVKFISFEPLLGPINDVDLEGIDWVIVGGESGPNARKVEVDWVRGIRDKCLERNIPLFFKQWGGVHKKKNGKELDGKTYMEFPRQE